MQELGILQAFIMGTEVLVMTEKNKVVNYHQREVEQRDLLLPLSLSFGTRSRSLVLVFIEYQWQK
jgi:hypothetical protein